MNNQRTIKGSASISGIGLQTGGRVSLTLKSAPAGSGISFVRTDLPNRPAIDLKSINLSDSGSAERRTALGFGPLQIQTTEHLLAALSGLSIDNIIIEIDNVELPGLDGSAKGFVELIKSAGIVEQDAKRVPLKVEKPVWCFSGDALIAAFPDEDFKISYTLSYNRPALGTQFYSFNEKASNFAQDVAPARTFCLEEEAAELLKRGLGKGADYNNTLVIGRDGPIKTSLRFPDEPVRHKVLDLIGDMYILGVPVIGRIVAIKSGHALNMELVKRLKGV